MLPVAAIQPQGLEGLQRRFKIQSLGNELEGSIERARLRLSLNNYEANHIYFIAEVIRKLPGHLKEISLNLRDSDAIFSAHGQHKFYLEQAGIVLTQKPLPTRKKSVFERLKPQKVDRDEYPKNLENNGAVPAPSVKNAEEKTQTKKSERFERALAFLMESIALSLPDMSNLEVLAFYGAPGGHWVSPICEGAKICSMRHNNLKVAVFNDLANEESANCVVQAAFHCQSLSVLAVQNGSISDEQGGDLISSLIKIEQNARDEILWEKTLRVEDHSNSRPASRAKSASLRSSSRARSLSTQKKSAKFMDSELREWQMRTKLRGIVFLDLSHNSLGNTFLEGVSEALKNDRYLKGIDLEGNDFLTSAREFVKILPFDDFFDVDEEFEEVFNKKGEYIPISIAINRFIVQEKQQTCMGPLEKFILRKVAPNANLPRFSSVAQLLAGYSRTTQQLEFLQRRKCHPLVEIVLYNNTLERLILDERIAYVLREFTNFKLQLNADARKALSPRVNDELDEMQLVEARISDKKRRKDVSGMVRKLAEAEDYIKFGKASHKAIEGPEKYRESTKIAQLDEKYARDFRVANVKSSRSTKTSTEASENQLKSNAKAKSEELDGGLERLRSQVRAQQKEVDKMLASMAESRSIAEQLETETQVRKYPRVSEIIIDHEAAPQPMEDGRDFSPIPAASFPSSSSESSLFNEVLDATYQYLMRKYSGDKARALECFEEHQDKILECCQGAIHSGVTDAKLIARLDELLDEAFSEL